MKKSKFSIAAIVLSTSLLFSSCIGSFGLHNKLLSWNHEIGNKFVNELVYFAFNIIPIYPVCYITDMLILNSIEFWSGSNPIADVGTIKRVKGENGNYLVETLENGYIITKEGVEGTTQLTHNAETNIWSVEANGEQSDFLRINDDNTADLLLPNGNVQSIQLNAEGLQMAKEELAQAL
ncbi:MAG: DUF3332 domain-containing protein [Bacteroides sp.]|nr:DUF3332 domain-containing protein [Bacteroides sp.]MDD2645361.1 DUF3332 domain-containing protein [Bacteroides sp.]MDD4055265.1 DUF3332 domain-containing protein [Bacteroides sp.]MDD4719967.1 DUF3332 domain-containing protein [Bacteroides sp.]NLI63251.1 DUF3332 domain-containing protein [Bacteroidales bacterium]